MTNRGKPLLFGAFEGVPITLHRTDREKSIALSVRNDNIRVLAPQRVTNEEIHHLITRKARWLRGKLAKNAEIKYLTEHSFIDGEKFPFLGKYYPLQVLDGPKARAELVSGILIVHTRRSHEPERRARSVKAALLCWYKTEAAVLIRDRVRHHGAVMKLTPSRITFRDNKSMWGKCSSEGVLMFNWKLVMAPLKITDYVVVHELAHLRHMDHSRHFWQEVAKVLPDYKRRRNWLRDHGGTLAI